MLAYVAVVHARAVRAWHQQRMATCLRWSCLQVKRRVVVFIDDLDRCSADSIMLVRRDARAVLTSGSTLLQCLPTLARSCQTCLNPFQVLEATNLVLAACDMTTVLGVATDRLYKAIQSHYSSKADKKSPNAVASVDRDALQLQYLQPLDKKEAREYLQKIVQASCWPSARLWRNPRT